MFSAIEDFHFQTRSEATVELIRLGLEALKREQQEAEATSPGQLYEKETIEYAYKCAKKAAYEVLLKNS